MTPGAAAEAHIDHCGLTFPFKSGDRQGNYDASTVTWRGVDWQHYQGICRAFFGGCFCV